MNKFTQHCLVINLSSRPDRWEHVQQELRSVQILNPMRFDAIVDVSGNGSIGCGASHLACMEKARDMNWPFVCIVEDDIHFSDPETFLHQLRNFTGEFEEGTWDVLLLGGNLLPPYQHFPQASCLRVTHSQTATGYIVPNCYFEIMIQQLRKGLDLLRTYPSRPDLYANDMYWIHLQKIDRWFVLFPLTITQYPNFSDIEKKQVNYERAMLGRDSTPLKPLPNVMFRKMF